MSNLSRLSMSSPSREDVNSAMAIQPIDPKLLKKYDVRGPRYTSYPTADRFQADFSEHDLLSDIQPDVSSIAPISLYIHLPFCNTLCHYCGCNKIVTNKREALRTYLDNLRHEMALMRLQFNVYKRPVMQLHWGGGTPTFLDEAEMTELMHHTAKYFNLVNDENRDYGIEVDPRSLTTTKIDLLRGIGFNRMSIGVQDFEHKVQKAVNRVQDFDMIKDQVDYVRARAFRSVNFDLIYGLPFQTLETIERTLDKVIELSPDRISYYNYAHMPHLFVPQRQIKEEDLPSPDEKIEMISFIIEKLCAAGYEYIGMDHFVKSTDTLAKAKREGNLTRNFQGYSVSKANDLVGIGVSAISSFDRVYSQNDKTVEEYYEDLSANRLPVAKGITLTDDDIMRREIIQKLSCYRHLDKRAIEDSYDIQFDELFSSALAVLEHYKEDDIVVLEKDSITITEKGSPFIRNICMAFDAYIETEGKNLKSFSRII